MSAPVEVVVVGAGAAGLGVAGALKRRGVGAVRLERYAQHHAVDMRLGVAVERITRGDDGWCPATSGGDLTAFGIPRAPWGVGNGYLQPLGGQLPTMARTSRRIGRHIAAVRRGR